MRILRCRPLAAACLSAMLAAILSFFVTLFVKVTVAVLIGLIVVCMLVTVIVKRRNMSDRFRTNALTFGLCMALGRWGRGSGPRRG